ncbi:MAG: hypothetical protein JWM21_3543 [Acidobacteria bacterium]|nr:hypothetical protein [Acidobacteriota bacterium]
MRDEAEEERRGKKDTETRRLGDTEMFGAGQFFHRVSASHNLRVGSSSFILHPLIIARVAQLIEPWSYKLVVEGLNPSSGTRWKG